MAQTERKTRSVGRVVPGTAKTANANFFTDNITPTGSCLMRLSICLSQAGVCSILVSAYTIKLNAGVALTADCLYTIEFQASPLDSINVRTSIGCQVLYCNLVSVNG